MVALRVGLLGGGRIELERLLRSLGLGGESGGLVVGADEVERKVAALALSERIHGQSPPPLDFSIFRLIYRMH